MADAMRTELNILVPLCFCLLGLFLVVLIDPYIQKTERRIMLIIMAMTGALMIDQFVSFYSEIVAPNYIIRAITSIIAYSLRPAILVMFCRIVDRESRLYFEWGLAIVNMLIHMTALFSHICFWITPDNFFLRGPLGYTSHVVSAVLMFRFLVLSLRGYRIKKMMESFVQLFIALLIIVATMLDSFGGEWRFFQVSLILPTIVICVVFEYIWLHLQYVREHEQGMMAEQRIKMLVSQIHPHFIYNCLTVISAYLDEPEKAEEALEKFTSFLRGSIDHLDTSECIEAGKEFETVEHFLYLEKERFGDNLKVEYNVTDIDYKLPAYTVQTLVDNAIRHGIANKKDGGTLTLNAYETGRYHVIEVGDDGMGFSMEEDRSRAHIGLNNVKERLEYMCRGSLLVESRKGNGTVVIVKIPKSKERRAD